MSSLTHHSAVAQVTMNNYTAYPPFISKTVPPAVMLMMTKDHRLFFKGYNDIVDLDDGKRAAIQPSTRPTKTILTMSAISIRRNVMTFGRSGF